MKIIAFADVHFMFHKVNIEKVRKGDYDVIIIAGDLGNSGYKHEGNIIKQFLDSLNPRIITLFVSGNHDPFFYDYDKTFYDSEKVKHLVDESYTIKGIKFYGSPWTEIFYDWNWMKNDKGMKKVANQIPEDVDVLITHGPPYGIMDKVSPHSIKNLGCPYLLNKIKKITPAYHIFGHIHGGYGKVIEGDTTFLNVSINDELYNPVNPIVEFEI